MKTTIAMLAISLLMLTSAQATSTVGNEGHKSISIEVVTKVFEELGYNASEHLDESGDPHLTIENRPDYSDGFAVFFNDCGVAGCEEMTLYLDFGTNDKLTLETLNDWNHISSGFRSTAFMSGDLKNGRAGLKLHLSMYSDEDVKEMTLITGLFIIEGELFNEALQQ